MSEPRTAIDFEKTLAELERLVAQLEEGKLGLEESLRAYERGCTLSRACERALQAAEARIRILSTQDTTAEPEDFTPDGG